MTMRKLAIVLIIAALFLGFGRADADMLFLGLGGAGGGPPSTTQLTNDGATLTLTNDSTTTLVAQ